MLTDKEKQEYQEFRVMTQAHLASLQEMVQASNTRADLQEKLIVELRYNVQHLETVARSNHKRLNELEIATPLVKVVSNLTIKDADKIYKRITELEKVISAPGRWVTLTSKDCQPHGRYTDLVALGERVADNHAMGVDIRKCAQEALNLAKGGV